MSCYEIIYYYHERLPDGKWNTDERHEMKKKVGGPTDDIELEKLAAIIMTQLAKRDKLVVDVDVYEYAKKKVNFKEATDGSGIVLKNKKFSATAIAGQLIAEDLAAEEPQHGVQPHNTTALQPLPRNENAARVSNRGRVQLWMVYDPELPLLHEARAKGLKFTVGKKYPIYEMEPHPTGVGNVLTIVDDAGRQQFVSDKFFVANTQVRLIGDNEVEGGFGSTPNRGDPHLSYTRQYDNFDMPNLRPNLARGV